jgi:hypothetical protein
MKYERDFRIDETYLERASGFERTTAWLAAMVFGLACWLGVIKLALFLLK